MPRITEVNLDQINRQISDVVDSLRSQVTALQKQVTSTSQLAVLADAVHAPQTTNNLTFTWTGGTQTLSWTLGFIKDKNWSAQTTARPVGRSGAPGQVHTFPVTAGSLPLNPSTYYWLAWDPTHQKMLASTTADALHAKFGLHVICQLFTGTAGQTGTAGGGGSQGGSDLSGARYKLF